MENFLNSNKTTSGTRVAFHILIRDDNDFRFSMDISWLSEQTVSLSI